MKNLLLFGVLKKFITHFFIRIQNKFVTCVRVTGHWLLQDSRVVQDLETREDVLAKFD